MRNKQRSSFERKHGIPLSAKRLKDKRKLTVTKRKTR